MSLFDSEDRLEKEIEFKDLLQKVIADNIRSNRVLIIIIGENWAHYNDSDILQSMIDPSFHLSVYPKPFNYGYGNNFPLNLIDIIKEKDDMVLFNHVDRISKSKENQEWEYLINLVAKGEYFRFDNDLKFDFRRRALILVCEELPDFVKSNHLLYSKIIELNKV